MRASVVQPEPTADSTAAAELALAKDQLGQPRAVERMIRCADLWTLIAADQLLGLSLIVRNGESVLSAFPLVRSIVEHSASVVWVLDPEATTRDRAIRAALAVLHSDDEMVKAAARMGGSGNEVHKDAKARLNATRSEIQEDFGSLDLQAGTLEGQKLPGPTFIVEHFGNRWGDGREWLGMYDYLCAAATHPSFAVLEFIEPTTAGTALVMRGDFLIRLIRAAFVPFAKALEHFAAYEGWTRERLDDYMDRANEALGELGEVFPSSNAGDA